jgi:uncharacterized protein (DUF2252 family)
VLTRSTQRKRFSHDEERLAAAVAVPNCPAISLPSPDELYKQGKKLRDKCPRQSHAVWKPPASRPDPIALLEESSQGRLPQLIPIRYGRMMQSPFTFFRGAALAMADDLSHTPASGLRVQACGDAHLLNFGGYATPERREIFDINDLDETLPAPWEWDVKRLSTSFVLACRNNGFSDDFGRDTAQACVRYYRHRMAEFSQMPVLDIWYSRTELKDLIAMVEDPVALKRSTKRLAKAKHGSLLEHEFPRLTTMVENLPIIKDSPPLIYHWAEEAHKAFFAKAHKTFLSYRHSLEDDRRLLLDRFQVRDIAIKVVGVGSVGTFCAIALLLAAEKDPLFLQIKEARASVLERYAGKSIYSNHGQRVVVGARLMQSASDLFLGWTVGWENRHFYIRQLKDMKVKPMVEIFSKNTMMQYAKFCGWVLARAHARSGQPALINGYLGQSDKFDEAIADFSVAYADQSERDHAFLVSAVRKGRLQAVVEGNGTSALPEPLSSLLTKARTSNSTKPHRTNRK